MKTEAFKKKYAKKLNPVFDLMLLNTYFRELQKYWGKNFPRNHGRAVSRLDQIVDECLPSLVRTYKKLGWPQALADYENSIWLRYCEELRGRQHRKDFPRGPLLFREVEALVSKLKPLRRRGKHNKADRWMATETLLPDLPGEKIREWDPGPSFKPFDFALKYLARAYKISPRTVRKEYFAGKKDAS